MNSALQMIDFVFKMMNSAFLKGGSVVIVQLENEYGGDCKNDPKAKTYMEHLYSLETTQAISTTPAIITSFQRLTSFLI